MNFLSIRFRYRTGCVAQWELYEIIRNARTHFDLWCINRNAFMQPRKIHRWIAGQRNEDRTVLFSCCVWVCCSLSCWIFVYIKINKRFEVGNILIGNEIGVMRKDATRRRKLQWKRKLALNHNWNIAVLQTSKGQQRLRERKKNARVLSSGTMRLFAFYVVLACYRIDALYILFFFAI